MITRIVRPTIGAIALILLVATLVAPYIPVGPSVAVRIEMFWLPVLLVVTLPLIRVSRITWLLAMFWLWLAAVTLVSLARGIDGTVSLATAAGYARVIAITALFYNLRLSEAQVVRGLTWFVHMAIPLGFVGLTQAINFGPVVAMTLAHYSGSGRTSLETQLATFGRLSRATGSFEAPSFAAVYFLLAIGTGLWLLSGHARYLNRWSRTFLVVGIVSAIIGGMMTLSSTFIAGVAALIVVLMLVSPWSARVRLTVAASITGALALPLFVFSVSRSPVAAGSLNYQLARLSNLNVFATRFGDQGLLVPTIDAVLRMPLTGWGFFTQPGIFLGDSAYVVWLYMGGAIGLLFMLAILVLCAHQVRSLGPLGTIVLIWLVVLLASGFGSPSFSIPRIGDWWWALAAMTAAGAKHWRTP